jgi:hypothetical protein
MKPRRFGFILVMLAMFSLIGGHWGILQTVAWAGMIIDYSKNAPITSAIKRTFSGEAPCRMCHAVEDGRKKEQNLPATLKVDKKSDSFLAADSSCRLLPLAKSFSYPSDNGRFLAARSSQPPDPVPIAA